MYVCTHACVHVYTYVHVPTIHMYRYVSTNLLVHSKYKAMCRNIYRSRYTVLHMYICIYNMNRNRYSILNSMGTPAPLRRSARRGGAAEPVARISRGIQDVRSIKHVCRYTYMCIDNSLYM